MLYQSVDLLEIWLTFHQSDMVCDIGKKKKPLGNFPYSLNATFTFFVSKFQLPCVPI